MERADDELERLRIERVDFIKLDIEGAELSFLQGACRTLAQSRPVILAEVQDLRCRPWGYAAREIIGFLTRANYCWFALTANGILQPISTSLRPMTRTWWLYRKSVPADSHYADETETP